MREVILSPSKLARQFRLGIFLLQYIKSDVGVLILGRLLQVLYSFLSIKVLTATLSVDSVAKYYLILSIIGMFSMGLLSPSGSFHTTKFNELHQAKHLFSSFIILFFFILLCYIISLPFLYLYFINGNHLELSFDFVFIILALELIFGTLAGTIISSFNMLFHRVRFVIYTNFLLYLGLGFAIFFTTYVSSTELYWLLGIMLAKLIVCILVLWDFKKLFKSEVDLKYLKHCLFSSNEIKLAIKFCAPLSLSAIAVWTQTNFYRFYVNEYFNLDSLAMVALGFAMATNLSMAFESIINQYLMPHLYKAIYASEKSRKVIYLNFFNSVIPLYLSFFIFLTYFSPLIIEILATDAYESANQYMIWGIAIEFVRVISRLLSNVLYLESNTKPIMLSSILGAMTLVSLLFSLINEIRENIMFIPVLIFSSALLSLFIIMYNVRNKTGSQYHFFRFLLVIIISCGVFTLSIFSYSGVMWNAVRLIIAGVYFLIIQFIFNKQIYKSMSIS